MNPGEIWQLEDGTRRLVLSHATYNASALGRVITAAVVAGPPAALDPFGVDAEHGAVYADRLMMHPRNWLTKPVARIADPAYAQVRRHLGFLLGTT